MRKIGIVLLPALAMAGHALAAMQPAQWYSADGVGVMPSIEVLGLYDSNLTNTNDDKVSSWGTIVSPAIALLSERDTSRYYAGYRLEWAEYFDSPEDNFVDHHLQLNGDWEFSARHRGQLSYDFKRTHDQRGDGISAGLGGVIDEPVQYNLNHFHGLYGYGALSASAQIELEANARQLDYVNFRDVTQYRDRKAIDGSVRFFYRVSSATRLLAELEALQSDYKTTEPNTDSRDFNDLFAYVGGDWAVTGKTKGRAKIGWQERKFKEGSRDKFADLSWSIAADWSPRTYSTVSLEGGRKAKAPEQGGDIIDNTNIKLDWQHYWQERLLTYVTFGYDDDDYLGITRQDKTYEGRIGVSYQFRRWLEISLWQLWRDKDSTVEAVSYDKQVTSLKLRLSL
ncbi:outer membrane beta-barrel protein [Agarivorans sp. MS3-6]|uniref:outer membrane beta-barrel protein n=1 Tax=Agarivorans sp. TSD2052 TaxID=2937286 RepID=UPI0020107DFE|nr:outer membrane beta-barrel protein [Agarivorans sp. TSD2052]UPW18393.1 outer membrane beta-barrel protein [Agarivorans sp. TSD2052]